MKLMRSLCAIMVALTAACTRPPAPAPARVVSNTHLPAHPKPVPPKTKPQPVGEAAPMVPVTVTDMLTPAQKEDLFNRFDAWQASHGSD